MILNDQILLGILSKMKSAEKEMFLIKVRMFDVHEDLRVWYEQNLTSASPDGDDYLLLTSPVRLSIDLAHVWLNVTPCYKDLPVESLSPVYRGGEDFHPV